MGRGTTVLEAALLGADPFGLRHSTPESVLAGPRTASALLERLPLAYREIDFAAADDCPDELLVFFHKRNLIQIAALKKYLLARRKTKIH